MREDEAVDHVAGLERDYISGLLNALKRKGHDELTREIYGDLIAQSVRKHDGELVSVRALPDGDAVADMIVKIRRLRKLTSPAPASGWRQGARWALVGLLAVTGAFVGMGLELAPVVSLAFAALGICGARSINWQLLGGRPETRHAIQNLTSPEMARRWAKLAEVVGPSPATVSLRRLQAEAVSQSHT